MPTVNVLGYGTVEFPDGMTQEEMAFALSQLPEKYPGTPSMGDQLLRQVGLTARAAGPVGVGALGGAALAGPPGAAVGALGVGLGQMLGDPLVGLYNRAMGSNVPTPSQSMESLMTKAGLPEPATPTERVVQDITRAGASATGFARGAGQMGATMLAGRQMAGQPAGIAPEILKLLGQYPAQQVSGAALAGGAGGMLREGDVGAGLRVVEASVGVLLDQARAARHGAVSCRRSCRGGATRRFAPPCVAAIGLSPASRPVGGPPAGMWWRRPISPCAGRH